MLSLIKKKDVLDVIKNKDKVMRFVVFLVCTFCLALLYNVFFVRYNLVIGGISGIAILVKNIFGISTTVFNNVCTFILLTISFLVIGKKETMNNILGAVVYPIMITITAPISKYIVINIESYLFMVLVVSVIYGVLYGILYKVGYNTGGTDIIARIIMHFKKLPMGSMSIYINIGIVLLGIFNLGVTKVIYGLLCMFLGNYITDFILLGNKDSKMCFIKTEEYKQLEKVLEDRYEVGYTVLKSRGGVDNQKKTTLFCIMPSEYYYDFCQYLKWIDKTSFLFSVNCYEVSGGYRKTILPF